MFDLNCVVIESLNNFFGVLKFVNIVEVIEWEVGEKILGLEMFCGESVMVIVVRVNVCRIGI